MGLPCGHQLDTWRRASIPVPLSPIHRHWRFDINIKEEEQVEEVPRVQDP